jgi:multidrug efflux system membrane fusion protein
MNSKAYASKGGAARKALRPLSFIAGLAALMLGAGCGKKDAAPQAMVIPVLTAEVKTMDFPSFISSFGSVSSISDVNVRAQVGGQIIEARFVEGQDVKAGDILFVIDKSPYQAAVAAAEGALRQDEASLGYNQYLADANKHLAEATVMAKQNYQQYVSNVESYTGKVEADKAQIQTAKINLQWCDVKAPTDGATGKILIDPGNIAATSDSLVNIKRLDPVYVDFTVPERYFPRAREAILIQKKKVKITAQPQGDDSLYEGVITLLDNSVDNATGTLPLRATVENPGRKLWPGQFVNVKVILDIAKDATVVPVDAVQSGRTGPYLFAMRDKKAVRVPVTIGQSDSDYTVILSGDIKPGEKVIKLGTILLSDGAAVMEAAEANAMFASMMAQKAAEQKKKKPAPAPPAKEEQKK